MPVVEIRKLVESIPRSRCFKSLQSFIELRLQNLGELQVDSVEQEAFAALTCANFE